LALRRATISAVIFGGCFFLLSVALIFAGVGSAGKGPAELLLHLVDATAQWLGLPLEGSLFTVTAFYSALVFVLVFCVMWTFQRSNA
jgi:hypothetical protein